LQASRRPGDGPLPRHCRQQRSDAHIASPDCFATLAMTSQIEKKTIYIRKISFYTTWHNGRGTMIESFKHKGLRQLFEDDSPRGVNAEHVRKIKQILATLEAAETIEALRLPTFGLHPLKGDLKGFWAVTVRANWRVIFRFDDGKASEIDLVDYH
jgi:proteic killer suppression protein